MKINIIIADDHKLMLDGLVSMFENEPHIVVAGTAKNGKEVLSLLKEHEVDIVLLDIEMPEMDGVETAEIIKEEFANVDVLVLTMHDEIGFIKRIMKAGTQGYVLKNIGHKELVAAIETIYSGEDYFGKDITKALMDSMRSDKVSVEIRFTKRELEVLKLIADGFTTKQISSQLGIKDSTVETHRSHLLEKTGLANSKSLVKFAVKKGYAD